MATYGTTYSAYSATINMAIFIDILLFKGAIKNQNQYSALAIISLYLKKSENIANFLAFSFGESVGVADDRGH